MSLNQTINGKSFEYALLTQFQEKLKDKTNVKVVFNSSFEIAKKYFDGISKLEQGEFLLYASFAVNFLIDLEPRLSNDINQKDVLELEIVPDKKGEEGDVRDILAIRILQKWEIGISAKNNHNVVKHSRLSSSIDFGQKWLGVSCSEKYFKEINIVFNELKEIKKASAGTKKWSELGDYHSSVYYPVLSAFIEELKEIYKNNSSIIASKIVKYLIGNKDFYKVVKNKKGIDIYAYNFGETLNLPFQTTESKYIIPKTILPTKILDISFKTNSKNTVILTLHVQNPALFTFFKQI